MLSLNEIFRKPYALLKRDFLIHSSYKFSFVFDSGRIVFSVLTFFFISKMIGKGVEAYLTDYGRDYFAFVLIGIAFYGYLTTAMSSFTQVISMEQDMGTLEMLLLTPTRFVTLLTGSSLWNFLMASSSVFLYVLLGTILFQFPLSHANLPAAAVIFILTIISFGSLGIISASFILIFKKGDPLNLLFSGMSNFLGGVYFPVTVLPLWLQKISMFLPLTYSLHGIRQAVLMGKSLEEIWPDVYILLIFCLALLPLSMFCFRKAINHARKSGSLALY